MKERKDQIKVKKRFKSLVRQLWSQSPYRNESMKSAKEYVDAGFYKNGKPKTSVKYRCAECGQLFDESHVEVDHIKELARIKWQSPMHEDLESIMS
jgi:hypothetical protein